jgi:hypothetical protein
MGHVDQISQKQARLRDALNLYEQNGCGGDGDNPIPSDAWEFATSNSHKSEQEIAEENGISVENVVAIAAVLGVGALVIMSAPAAAASGVAACFLLVVRA